MQHVVRDDHAVAGSEAFRYPLGEVQIFLNQDQGVGAVCLCFFNLFCDVGCILIGTVVHLRIEPGQVLCRILRIPSQKLFNLVFAEGVCIGSLLGVRTAAVIDAGTQLCAGRAGQPSVACGGGKVCVLRHRLILPPL